MPLLGWHKRLVGNVWFGQASWKQIGGMCVLKGKSEIFQREVSACLYHRKLARLMDCVPVHFHLRQG